ncbi:MAG: cobaltochelatase subunit CobN [Fibrobacter sp.]|nr:cobaltochelatase subunit CobN [Fibrobacter sp.]
MKKKAVFIFSHASLLNLWGNAKKLLVDKDIEIFVVNQSAVRDCSRELSGIINDADAVYFSGIRHFSNFDAICDACRSAAYVLPSGMEAAASFTRNDEVSVQILESYFNAGTVDDLANAVLFLLYKAGAIESIPSQPSQPLLCGIYDVQSGMTFETVCSYLTYKEKDCPAVWTLPFVAICFPRSWIVSDDLDLIKAAIEPLQNNNMLPVPVFCDGSIASQFGITKHHLLDTLLTECGAGLASIWYALAAHASNTDDSQNPFTKYNVPVFQIIRNYNQTPEEWALSDSGLSAMSICFSLTKPEMMGCIEPTLLACNEMIDMGGLAGKTYKAVPVPERIEHLAKRTARLHKLRTMQNKDKKVVIMLHNAPCKSVEATIATAAGLDAAQSAVDIMQRLKQDDYFVNDIPDNGKALLELMLSRKAINEFRWTSTGEIHAKGGYIAKIFHEEYMQYFQQLPENLQARMIDAWGEFPGEAMVYGNDGSNPCILITGIWFGNILLMLDPKRGCQGPRCDGEVCRILHEPDIPPPHHWLASYWYLQQNADAIISLGAESPLEYLPGKRVALGETCFPEISLGTLPVFYPYIVSATGEGLIAKRRGRAVLIGHLTAPIVHVTEENGCWAEIETLATQYYNAQSVNDYGRLAHIAIQLRKCLIAVNLLEDNADDETFKHCLEILPGRIAQLRKRFIEKQSHVLGRRPDKSIVKLYLDEARGFDKRDVDEKTFYESLEKTTDEMEHLIQALSGRFIAPGASGHLSRGKTDILPTGRNFYGIDLKAIPTKAAWNTGSETGIQILSKYLEEEGAFPASVAITLWSSDVFRADGELICQGLWLCGCRPVWNSGGRVTGIEIIPADELVMPDKGTMIKRPRVDIVVQMSSVVRDTLPVMYEMLDEAIELAASQEESEDVNYVRAHVEKRMMELKETMAGVESASLHRIARSRIFSSKQGSYGTGIGLAIDAAAWENDNDLAEAYINWTGIAYGKNMDGTLPQDIAQKTMFTEYSKLLGSIDIAYQKAIGPEYDALSCGCYSSFQGGMVSVNRAVGTGKAKMYWGDSSSGPVTEIRSLSDEIDVSLFARLLNPDWLNENKKDGYKGAGKISSMVNTLFHWSATSKVVTDAQFDSVWRMYIDNEENRKWLQSENIYALEEVTRRLLEASSRKMWSADSDKLEKLQSVMLTIEGEIEERMGTVDGEFQGSSVDIKKRGEVSKWKYEFTLT